MRLAILLFPLVAFGSFMVFGALRAITGLGHGDELGVVAVPGQASLALPAGSLDATIVLLIPGRGNATPDVDLPDDFAVDLTPPTGAAAPTIAPVSDASSNTSYDRANVQRALYRIDVPAAGQYQLTTRGSFDGLGKNVRLAITAAPPVRAVWVLIAGLAATALGYVAYFAVFRRRRRAAAR